MIGRRLIGGIGGGIGGMMRPRSVSLGAPGAAGAAGHGASGPPLAVPSLIRDGEVGGGPGEHGMADADDEVPEGGGRPPRPLGAR